MNKNGDETLATNEDVIFYLVDHFKDLDLLRAVIEWSVSVGAQLAKAFPDNYLICSLVRTDINIEGERVKRLIMSVFVANSPVEQLLIKSCNIILFEDEENNITGFREVEAVTLN